MKIEVTHVITADPQLISLVGAILSAIGKPSENLSVTDVIEPSKDNVSNKESQENTKATKRTYLLHEESGALIVVNKGEELAERLEQGLVEIPKAEYDRIQSEKQARIDKAKQDAENESTVDGSQNDSNSTLETSDHGITIEMVRAEAKKLTASGRQAEFKNILTSFDAPKLTAVPEEKYPDLLAAIKEAVGEE